MSLQLKETSARRFAAGMLSVLVVLAIVFGSLPQTVFASNGAGAPPAQATTCSQNHTVVAGDTLSALSVTYNISIAEIASANNLTEPYTLFLGQELCIPGAAQTAASTPSATSTPSANGTTEANSTTSSSEDPSMTVSVEENLLTIVTANLATNSSYYVKVAPYYVRSIPKWVKIGFLRTKNEGAVSKTFKLPKDVRGVNSIQVCLKNATSDDTICQRAAVVVNQ
jgi:LysM repeat protein